MNDDRHRAGQDHASASFAALRRIALNIFRANIGEGSHRGKVKRPAWSNDFLRKLITEF